ncbi:LEA type 2 family protein [Paraburkholderia sp. 35.1]|uniref:LEA type 2 family protein n=1 Tax=Paraburkholderia sp. 35.1 TaxID=2991058 RepID=UPI003D24459C
MSFFRALQPGLVSRVWRLFAAGVAVTLTLAGCAGLFGADPLRVNVAGIEPIAGQGMEMRFNVKLRVQNPNDSAVSFNGVSLDLELNGKPFATGVSDQSGTVPRFGETIVTVPLTVPAFAAVRQAFALAGAAQSGQVPYVLRGKLAGGVTGTTRFTDQGTLSLPSSDTGS